jgi:RecB family exonuclease
MPAAFSMSGLERADVCAPSTTLPQRREVYERTDAVRGNVIHDYLRDVRDLGLVEALRRAPEEWRDRLAAIEVERLPACEPEKFLAEVELAYNPVEDRALVMVRDEAGKLAWSGERAELGPDWIAGRPDVFAVLADRVVVLDYKTGWKRFAPAARVHQLRGYAVALARFFGKDLATVGIVRVRPDGSCWYDQGDLSTMDLDLTARRMRAALENSRQAPDPAAIVEGDHCRYCPAFESCPAKLQLIREVAAGISDDALDQAVANDPVKAVRWAQRAEQLAERVKERAGELAEATGGIDMGDGTFFGPRPYGRTYIDATKAAPVIAERFGEDIALAAVKPSMTQESLKSALQIHKKRTPGARIGELHENTMEALREAGAATVKVTYPVGIYEPEQAAKVEAKAALPAKQLPAAAGPAATIEIPH